MTDQQMDDRLRAAGERFRAATADSEPSADAAGRVTPTRAPRRSRFLLVAAAAAVVALVVGLTVALRGSTHSAPPSIDNAGLLGNVWLLSANGHPSTSALYISPSGQLVADDECQVIGAKAAVTGSRLTISGRIVRLKSCVDPGFSPTFTGNGTKVLRGTVTFHIDSRGMTVSHRGVGSLRFVLAQTPIPPPSLDIPTLTGTDWVAPNGNVLHIDPATGELSGGYCTGRAVVLATTIRFTSCYRIGLVQYRASVAANVLTLSPAGTTHGRNPGFRQTFAWRPADPAAIDATALTGRTWHLQTVNGAPASSGSLRIDGTTAVIDDGCTTYYRSVTIGSGTFTIAGGATPQACSDQATTADSFLFTKPATWTVRTGKLIVYGGGAQTFSIVYGPAGQPQRQDPSQLTDHTWQLTDTGVGPVEHAAIGEVTLSFPDPSTLSITRCYTSGASVDVTSSTLTVRGLHVTEALPCPSGPPGTQLQNDFIDSVFSDVAHWHVTGNRLTVTAGRGFLMFRISSVGTGSVHELRAHVWKLSRIETGVGSNSDVADFAAGVQVRRATRGVIVAVPGGCDLLESIGLRTGQVGFQRVSSHGPCHRDVEPMAERQLVGNILLGARVAWRINGSTLTLLRTGIGAVVFTRRR